MVILYADDDPDDHEVFSEIIQAINPAIRIHNAHNGREAIEALSVNTPDLIFLDVNMPYMSGYQALTEIRKVDKLKNVQVIMYSTNVYQKSFDEHLHLNARYLRKPNTIKEGVEAIRAIIDEKTTNIT